MRFKKDKWLEEEGKLPKTVEDLNGKTIGIVKGEDEGNWLPTNIQYKEIKKYNGLKELLQALSNDEIDGALENSASFYSSSSGDDSNMETIIIIPERTAIATRKQDVLLSEAIDAALKSMWNDGSLYWINSKYLPEYLIESYNYSPYK
jgi:ABC-type amino acid transport substrate-binding protein